MIIVGHSRVAKDVANQLNLPFFEVERSEFPDGEVDVRFPEGINGQDILLIQTIHGNPNDYLIEMFFMAYTAKDLGAKSVKAVIPYLVYSRQDTRFRSGEAISSNIVSELLESCIDEVFTIDPHLHRNGLGNIFKKIPAHELSSIPAIADYIKNRWQNPIIMCPDKGAVRIGGKIAEILGCKVVYLHKNMVNSELVEITMSEDVDLSDKQVVIVDDIISTGGTMAKVVQLMKEKNAPNVYCIGIHGLLIGNCLDKLLEAGADEVITTNSIRRETSKIDVSNVISEALKQVIK
ncbi:ribose-phosphate diphosphokinase [Candidatus Woesearchaeota archaeon]|nr:ribose-phosphate diphosphokinase [Candidatus Woesearchaeota archaeon]